MTNTDIVESTSGHRLSHFAVNVFSAEQDITAVIQKLSPAVEVKGRVRDKRFYASLDRLMVQVGRGYIDTQQDGEPSQMLFTAGATLKQLLFVTSYQFIP